MTPYALEIAANCSATLESCLGTMIMTSCKDCLLLCGWIRLGSPIVLSSASSVATSDYQSPEMPDPRFRLSDMSDGENSSSIQPQDSTHAEGFLSPPQQGSRFFPTPRSVASLTVRQRSILFSHTASDLGSNDGNADSEVEDEDDHPKLLPPTPNLQKRNACCCPPNTLRPSPAALSSSLPQPFQSHLTSALNTAQDSVSSPAHIRVPNHRSQPYNSASGSSADAEFFPDAFPAPKWNPPLHSSPPLVLFQPPPYLPPPPARPSPQNLSIHVEEQGSASITAVRHDNVEIRVRGRMDFNGYSQDGEIEDDQVDIGRGGGDASVGKKMKGRRQVKRRHVEPGHPRRRL